MHRLTFMMIAWLTLVAAGANAGPPNIVYIISDDQTYTDFGFMGNSRVHTPNLDALSAKSARYINGYVPASVCRPSLVTLLTGLYPHQHGVHFNHGPPGSSAFNRMTSREEYERVRNREFELIRNLETLPGILGRELGYRSIQTGKFWEGHWRNGGFTEGMTTFEPPPPGQAFGGERTLANGERAAHGNGDRGLIIGRETMEPIWNFIDACAADNSPWMVWYAPFLPHQPHDSPEEFYDQARSRPGVEKHELPYFAAIAQFDHTVGELVRYVEARGLAERTLFIFVVDNGWSPSRNREKSRPQEFAHTKESKRAPFDYGLRTPILIRWDGVVNPGTRDGLVNAVDLMPTILSAAGLRPPASLPGIDLMPNAREESDLDPGRAIFGEIYPGDATSLGHPERDVAYRWIRKGAHKLIVPHSHGAPPWGDYLREPALFDVVADPDEASNLIGDPDYAEIAESLRKELDAWWDGGSASGN